MGTVHAQLMGATSMRRQFHQCLTIAMLQHPIVRHGCLPMLRIDHLSRSVQMVRAQGQTDGALSQYLTVEQRDILFIYGTREELTLQPMIGILCQCYHHQPRSVHVQTVHHVYLRKMFAEQALHRWLLRLAWHRQQAGRLVNHHDALILIHHPVIRVTTGSPCFRNNIAQHPFQYGLTLAPTGWIVLAMMANLHARRTALPELSDSQGLQVVLIGILQQFRSTTLS